MVLFKKDILRDGVYIDVMTKNTSFLRMALHLREMGVENNTFFLSLYDRELIGIDPLNLEDDSLELRERIALECKINYWYFIREVARVVSSGSDGVRYQLNRANLAQAWIFLNSINGFLTMPRQCGKTIGMAELANWYLHVAGYKVTWGMFCQGSMLQWDNVKRIKELRDALPKYMYQKSVADANNKEGLSYAKLDTHLQTFIAQMDKQAADRQGRGSSTAVQSWDEYAYYVNNDLSWSSAKAAMNEAAPRAREAGLPAAVIVTTTAGDIDDKWGRNAYKMVQDGIRFCEQFYDADDREQLMDIIRHNSKNNIVYMEYSYKQLGKSEAWFEEVTRAIPDPKVIAKDYLNQWQHGSDNSLFEKTIIDRIVKSKREPVKTTMYGSIYIRWYKDPDVLMKDASLKNKPYVLGCDTSDNVGSDFTTVVMLDPYDLSTVCTIRCNETNLVFVSQCICKILFDFPRSIFIPERNKNGAYLVDYVILEFRKRGINPLKRIFNKYFQEYDPNSKLDSLNFDSGLVRKNFGFNTTASATSREFLYTRVMMTVLKLAADYIADIILADELCGLTTKNGRIDHVDGGHDDTVISYLLAAFFLIFALNHKYYGIDVDEVMCNIRSDGSECTLEEKKKIAQAKARLADYEDRLKRCTYDVLRNTYLREIQNLKAIIGDNIDEIPNENVVTPMSKAVSDAHHESHKSSIDPVQWIKLGMIGVSGK